MDDIEFDWEVMEIIRPSNDDGRRGAMVRYTPLETNISEMTIFVPVPWHKAADTAHAREIMERKINSHAPLNIWRKELEPDIEDKTDEIEAEFNRSLPRGERRESRTNPERGGDQPGIPEPGRPEGE